MHSYFFYQYGEREPEESNFEKDGLAWYAGDSGISIELLPDGRLVLQRTALLRNPLFYYSSEIFFAASTSWLELVQELGRRGIALLPDTFYLREYLARQCPFTRHTFCAGIFSLRNGETVVLEKGRYCSSSLETPALLDGECSLVPRLRSSLAYQLADIPLDRSCFHLSAGLDSSALVLLASQLHQSTVRTATCSLRGEGPGSEIEVVRKLENEFDLDLEVFDFHDADVFAVGRSLISEGIGFPIAHPSHLVRFMMDRDISRRGSSLIITGQGADEVLGGYGWYGEEYSDPARHEERIRVTAPEMIDRILGPVPPRGVDHHAPADSLHVLSMKARIQYDLWTVWEAWAYIDSSFSECFGVSYLNPFADSNLMASLLALPDEYRIRDGETKWLLREALKDIYPEYLLEQPKRGLRLDLKPYFLDFTCRDLTGEIFDSSAFSQQYLNCRECERMVRQTLDGKKNYGWQLWSLFLCGQAFELLKKNGLGQ